MTNGQESLLRHEIRSPRAAAIAGIAYSILMITVMVISSGLSSVEPENITSELLEAWNKTASVILIMVPFAGITFLYFTGVIRDRLREREDRFFATLFFGSGIILVILWFVWGAILGALMRIRVIDVVGSIGADIYIFGSMLMSEIIGNYSLRMAGIYMTTIGTLWTRTKLAPSWLIFVTYFLALGFLIAAERIREARFIFPIWVFIVSVYILIMNYRRTHEQESISKATQAE